MFLISNSGCSRYFVELVIGATVCPYLMYVGLFEKLRWPLRACANMVMVGTYCVPLKPSSKLDEGILSDPVAIVWEKSIHRGEVAADPI